jgi:phenylpropionate dioxygenase-like ring-hydroxylating dioxygenase large terminal subunit
MLLPGWQFDREGRCRNIPSLLPDSPIKVERIRAKSLIAEEREDYVWVFARRGLPGSGDAGLSGSPHFSENYRLASISRPLRM